MPIIVKAAREVYNGLQLSYQSGLIDYARLSQAQFELLKAEYNQANANLQVARSFLAIAIAKGNLTIFLDQLK
jgi:outer membrane protein TolC